MNETKVDEVVFRFIGTNGGPCKRQKIGKSENLRDPAFWNDIMKTHNQNCHVYWLPKRRGVAMVLGDFDDLPREEVDKIAMDMLPEIQVGQFTP